MVEVTVGDRQSSGSRMPTARKERALVWLVLTTASSAPRVSNREGTVG